jgi:hypothetical protein
MDEGATSTPISSQAVPKPNMIAAPVVIPINTFRSMFQSTALT